MERTPSGRTVHGTYVAYARRGCRCTRCSTYQAERVARNRAERKARGVEKHGVRSSYDAGCRCDECKWARRNAYLRLEKARELRALDGAS
jgi:hypothetical protein